MQLKTAQPFNWNNPLNYGTQGFWAGLPHLTGGPLCDITGFNAPATWTPGTSTNANAGWRPPIIAGQPNSFLISPANDCYFTTPATGIVTKTFTQLTLAAYVNMTGAASTGEILKNDGAWLLRNQGSSIYFDLWGPGGFTQLNGSLSLGISFIVATYNASAMVIYVNGVQVATTTPGAATIPATSTAMTFGDQPGGGEGFQGYIGPIQILNVAWNQQQVLQAYYSALAGYRSQLNYHKEFYSGAAASTVAGSVPRFLSNPYRVPAVVLS